MVTTASALMVAKKITMVMINVAAVTLASFMIAEERIAAVKVAVLVTAGLISRLSFLPNTLKRLLPCVRL